MENDTEDDGDESLEGAATITMIAARLGLSGATVSRAAKKHGIGTMFTQIRVLTASEAAQLEAILQAEKLTVSERISAGGKRGGRAISIKRWGHADGIKTDKYAASNPDRLRANRLVKTARISGKIKPMPCEVCGKAKTMAHHDDYNKPLDVRWLCHKCHRDWHKNNKPIEKTHD